LPTVWTIGYERLLPAELVAELEVAQIERLIDVRHRPQSRRPGMSKTRLGQLLHDHGIAYESRKQLGTPPDIRFHYKSGKPQQGASLFRAHIEQHHAHDLDELAAELDDGPRAVLMCLEADPAVCHRRVLTEVLCALRPDLEVVDL
jgi:uncharacterized protein (DUF488 family)